MVTIFTIPKSFADHQINIIQRNAIKSWFRLTPNFKVILMGNDYGIAEIAKELNVNHIANIEKSEFGTPLVGSAFKLAQNNSNDEFFIYLNADIILLPDFKNIIQYLPQKEFLGTGRRIDLDINYLIDFLQKDWNLKLENEVKKSGTLHSVSGMDYFIFRKNSFIDMPPLTVGRIGWDNWMIYNARKKQIPIIDLTKSVLAIHQNHLSHRLNDDNRKNNPEALKNMSFIEDKTLASDIRDADWKLTKNGLKKRWLYWWPRWKRIIVNKF